MRIPTRLPTIIAAATTRSAKTLPSVTSVGTLDAATVWTGRPGGGIRFQRGDIFLVPFSLLWCGFAVFWETTVIISREAPWPMIVFGGAFVLVGLYFVAGRFIFDMYMRSQTTYGLTRDSALINVAALFGRRSTIYLPSVSNLNLDLAQDGTGSIFFGDPPGFWSGAGWVNTYQKVSPGFLYIDRAADVFELCKRLQRGSAP